MSFKKFRLVLLLIGLLNLSVTMAEEYSVQNFRIHTYSNLNDDLLEQIKTSHLNDDLIKINKDVVKFLSKEISDLILSKEVKILFVINQSPLGAFYKLKNQLFLYFLY